MESKKGFSLIEIVVGLVVITLFLVLTGSLINSSYNNYKMIMVRNDALEFAIEKMEEVLKSTDEIEPSDVGYRKDLMESRVTISNVKKSDGELSDKVFLVTVNVEYKKTASDSEKYNLKLESLKIVK